MFRKCKRGVDLVEIQNFFKRFSYNTDDRYKLAKVDLKVTSDFCSKQWQNLT